jgi:hypothetical protein
MIIILNTFKGHLYVRQFMKEMRDVIELYKANQELEFAKKQGNHMLALELYNRIIMMKQHLSNKLGIAKSVAEKANLLERMGFQNKALEEYLNAYQIVAESSNKEFFQIIQNKIQELNSRIGEKR